MDVASCRVTRTLNKGGDQKGGNGKEKNSEIRRLGYGDGSWCYISSCLCSDMCTSPKLTSPLPLLLRAFIFVTQTGCQTEAASDRHKKGICGQKTYYHSGRLLSKCGKGGEVK